VINGKKLLHERKAALSVAALCLVLGLGAAFTYINSGDGLLPPDPPTPERWYAVVFLMVWLDAVVPIFPGETTLNAASTAAANGTIDLAPVIWMGALGAIVGDSTLFWIARRFSRRLGPQLERARANDHVRDALATMNSSAAVLIVGGRYVPGMRFVVNATMGLSDIRYRRFLAWSVLSGILWSTYTCVLAYKVSTELAGFPLASVVISGLVTTIALAAIFMFIRRRKRRTNPIGTAPINVDP
jgi:membrane protein DedA with SNARE-associated domain